MTAKGVQIIFDAVDTPQGRVWGVFRREGDVRPDGGLVITGQETIATYGELPAPEPANDDKGEAA